jgi:hypothetical protein
MLDSLEKRRCMAVALGNSESGHLLDVARRGQMRAWIAPDIERDLINSGDIAQVLGGHVATDRGYLRLMLGEDEEA